MNTLIIPKVYATCPLPNESKNESHTSWLRNKFDNKLISSHNYYLAKELLFCILLKINAFNIRQLDLLLVRKMKQ